MTNPVIPPAAPAVPVYPALGSPNFNQEAYTYGSSMPAVSDGIGAIGDATYTNAVAANERAVAADSSAAAAAAQADAAMGYRNTAQAAATTATTKAAEADASAIAASKLNLGEKAAPPTTDNQGQPLRAGATYYDTTLAQWRVWNGTAWVAGLSIDVANDIHTAAAKPTPADADEFGFIDSAASWVLKKLTWANLKAALASLFVSKSGATMTGDLTVPSLNGGPLAGHRRRNLNGDCRIAQLGASYAGVNGHTIDMWSYYWGGSQVSTITQAVDAPTGSGFLYSHRSTVTTSDAAITADDFAIHRTVLEGFDVADFVGKTFTVSFWVRSAKTGVHCVALRNSGLDRSYVHEITIAAANTWENHSFTVVGGLPTGGTWNLTNGVGLEVDFVLAAGSSFHTTADAWQTGSLLATANQVNVLDTVDNIFAVTGLQVEPGDTPTPYERRGAAAETAQVQRYGRLNGGVSGWSTSTTEVNGLAVDFSQSPMRATPSILLINGTNSVHDPGIANRNLSAPIYSGNNIGGWVIGTVSATTANKLHNLHPGAVFFDARL